MQSKKVKYLLLASVLIMAVIPLLGTIYFLDKSLHMALNIGFNNDVVAVLDGSAANLKTLKELDAGREVYYRSEFERVVKLKQVYDDQRFVKNNIESSLKMYSVIGFLTAAVLSLMVSILLSRKIAGLYQSLFDKYIKEQEKANYLEEISSWQELAKMLAHEIKNPLTPIEVLMSSLLSSYSNLPKEEFKSQLEKTHAIMNEEVSRLADIVDKFSEFSNIPKVVTTDVGLDDALRSILNSIEPILRDVVVSYVNNAGNIIVSMDITMFRQVILNLLRNGVEANPDRNVKFTIASVFFKNKNMVRITIKNDGVPIDREFAKKIFEPYVSSKNKESNVGLGLTIIKKIIIEHGGDINYQEEAGEPMFNIMLPAVIT